MKRKRVKIKYKNILIMVLILIGLILFFPKKKSEEKELINNQLLGDYVGKNISELEKFSLEKKISLKKDYQFNKDYANGEIIEVNYDNNEIVVQISKGKMSEDVYREKAVNELGNVPIMMYHGIIDTVENKYTGGNVDKDGYNRTSKAFREDLEFYYNNGYRMIRLSDYVKGIVDVPLGYSPIILTFDDGNQNNFNVLGRNSDGSLNIDPECAIGILESFKSSHPDMNITATFFVMNDFFNQKEYNEEILNWLIEHGYDVGNHTTTHPDFTKISISKTQEVVGKMYQKLDAVLKDKYVKIVALPFGSPYKMSHENYPYILNGEYEGYHYETEAALRVGWEPELSPFNKDFNEKFLKRCRAYDNNGKEFDIEMVFKNLEKNKYISDGDKDTIVIKKKDENKLSDKYQNVIMYGE